MDENHMDENRPHSRDLGAEHPTVARGGDYEYDEAHDDVPAGPLGETPAPHRVDPPHVSLGAGGDYGYDEAHDFGAT
jgi:hypothetical protein